jgi:hypothetical protein
MHESEWDIRRAGRAWRGDEFQQRIGLQPEKLEVSDGKLLWSDEERIALLGLLLENVGTDHAVRLGDITTWRDAIALRWLREIKAADPAYRASLREWASEFIQSTVESDMASLRVDVEIASPLTGARSSVRSALVNPDALLSWMPAEALEALAIERRREWEFLLRDGFVLRRSTGSAIVRVGAVETCDEVVFGEPGDPVILGARSLDGLNLRIDPLNGRLVDAGPAPAALAAH